MAAGRNQGVGQRRMSCSVEVEVGDGQVKRRVKDPFTIEPLLVDAAKVGTLLGVPTWRVWRLVPYGKLPHGVRIGRSRRWRMSQLRAWMEAGQPRAWDWDKVKGERGFAGPPPYMW